MAELWVGGQMRRAITLLELVVVVAVIAILLALLIPAAQYARETARRTACQSNLRQIAVACHIYESQHRMFPPGSGQGGASPHVAILPFLERSDLLQLAGQTHFNNIAAWKSPAGKVFVQLFVCPSDGAPDVIPIFGSGAGTSYAANSGTWFTSHGYNGMFRVWDQDEGGPPVSAGEVGDGLSNTSLFAEILRANSTYDRRRAIWFLKPRFSAPTELDAFADSCAGLPADPHSYGWGASILNRGRPWVHGNALITWYNHVLTPNHPSCYNDGDVRSGASTAASQHSAGVNVAFADAHIAFLGDGVERNVWRALASRDGNAN